MYSVPPSDAKPHAGAEVPIYIHCRFGKAPHRISCHRSLLLSFLVVVASCCLFDRRRRHKRKASKAIKASPTTTPTTMPPIAPPFSPWWLVLDGEADCPAVDVVELYDADCVAD